MVGCKIRVPGQIGGQFLLGQYWSFWHRRSLLCECSFVISGGVYLYLPTCRTAWSNCFTSSSFPPGCSYRLKSRVTSSAQSTVYHNHKNICINTYEWYLRSALVSGTWSYRSTYLPGMVRVFACSLFTKTNQNEPIHIWILMWTYISYCLPRMDIEVRNQSTQLILEASILLLYRDASTPPLSI